MTLDLRHRLPLLAVPLALALALPLASCGSNVDPSQVVGAGFATGAQGSGGTTTDGTTLAGGGLTPTDGLPDTTSDGSVDGVGTDAGSGTGGTTTGGGGGASGGGSGGTSGGNSGGTGGANKGASCDGFKNQTGITDKEILIGNASDISGPVPGLFEASQDALKAYVAFFNATNDICGRKLRLVLYDSRTDAAADQQAYTKACTDVFATVGSTSAFDSGGAPVAQKCGLPDIRGASVTNERNNCTTCFGAQSTKPGENPNAVPDFIIKNYGSASQHAAFFYINAGAAAQNAPLMASSWTKRGMKFPVLQGIDISEFNYAPYVQQLKDKNIEIVFWQGAYQQSVKLRKAMEQQGYTPKLYMRDPTDYNPDYVTTGGSAVEGTVIYMNFVPFEEAKSNQQMATYLGYLQQVKPGATPTFFGVFSWSAAQLFTERAKALGGNLSRATLVDAVKKVHTWDNSRMHSPQHPGTKHANECLRFIQLKAGKWVPIGGTKLQCSGLTIG